MAKDKGITPEEKGAIKARIAALLGGEWDGSQLLQVREEIDALIKKIEKRCSVAPSGKKSEPKK